MKIHIDIRDVVAEGRVSNFGKEYCYATQFSTTIGPVWVTTRPYRKSDCFLVVKHKEGGE